MIYLLTFLSFFFCFREREKERMSGRGEQKEREGNLRRLHTQNRAQVGLNSKTLGS